MDKNIKRKIRMNLGQNNGFANQICRCQEKKGQKK